MAIRIRRSAERGAANFGWLDTRHTFSFGQYYDPKHMGFGPLRVINDDKVAAGGGFPMHQHDNMEIVTYIVGGALEHKDSLGTGSVIRPGDVQRMTAGTGIRHSEFNPSKSEAVHLLQIWILPEREGLKPAYEQKTFPLDDRRGKLQLVASRLGREGSVTINQDVDLYSTVLSAGQDVSHAVKPGRLAWLQIARGAVTLNGERLAEGDGASVDTAATLSIAGTTGEAEVLLFDMVP